MMSLKKATAALLLIVLAMQLSFTQVLQNSNKKPLMPSKIALAKQVYSKEEVETIIAIIMEESESSIDTAFAEGYKQGLLAAAPDSAYYQSLAQDLEKEAARLAKQKAVPWWSIPLSIIGGTAAGILFAQIRR